MFSFTCPSCGDARYSSYNHQHLEQFKCEQCGTVFRNIFYVPGSPIPLKSDTLGAHPKDKVVSICDINLSKKK